MREDCISIVSRLALTGTISRVNYEQTREKQMGKASAEIDIMMWVARWQTDLLWCSPG